MNAQLQFKSEGTDETFLWGQARQVLQSFPDAQQEVIPGLKWGSAYQLYTPAFWKYQYMTHTFSGKGDAHRLADSVRDEIVMCMLGGYGIPSEMGILAYGRLRSRNLIKPHIDHETLFKAMSEPFHLGNGKKAKYRFARQKADYIHDFLNRADIEHIPAKNDLLFRDWLMSVKGIGYKTASWITRNWLRSEKVAILDIHLLRAGVLTGFFKPDYNLNTEYLKLEQRFLTFCNQLDVRPSDMDAIIWYYMKKNNKLAINILASIT